MFITMNDSRDSLMTIMSHSMCDVNVRWLNYQHDIWTGYDIVDEDPIERNRPLEIHDKAHYNMARRIYWNIKITTLINHWFDSFRS